MVWYLPLQATRVKITPLVWLLVCPVTSHVGQNYTHGLFTCPTKRCEGRSWPRSEAPTQNAEL